MQTIGERLEEARKKKGISIREAAEATKIRGDYLQKFESNQFDIGLTEIYTRGFLRNYANFLKVPADRVLNDYAALGRGDVRPRQPSREIYGRMDITVATAGESNERASPPEEGAAVAEPAPTAARNQPRYPRGSGPTLPAGPDPALVFKYIKIGGIVVIVLLAALIIKAIFSGGASTSAAKTGATSAATAPIATAPAAEPTFTLVASNPVYVKVAIQNPDLSAGQILFDGILSRGERKALGRPAGVWLLITASVCENLSLDINGTLHPMSNPEKGLVGNQTGKLPPP